MRGVGSYHGHSCSPRPEASGIQLLVPAVTSMGMAEIVEVYVQGALGIKVAERDGWRGGAAGRQGRQQITECHRWPCRTTRRKPGICVIDAGGGGAPFLIGPATCHSGVEGAVGGTRRARFPSLRIVTVSMIGSPTTACVAESEGGSQEKPRWHR